MCENTIVNLRATEKSDSGEVMCPPPDAGQTNVMAVTKFRAKSDNQNYFNLKKVNTQIIKNTVIIRKINLLVTHFFLLRIQINYY